MPRVPPENGFVQPNHKHYMHNVKRRVNKLFKNGNVAFLQIKNKGDELPQEILQNFYSNHIKKWRKAGKVSNFAFKKYRSFHSEVVKHFSQKGWLYFSYIKFNNRNISFSYAFRYNYRLYKYISTYDTDFEKYSPSVITSKFILDSCTDPASEVSNIDLLRGSESYKMHWTDSYHTNNRLLCAKKGLKAKPYLIYANIMDRLYKTVRLKKPTRYVYKVLRNIKLWLRG